MLRDCWETTYRLFMVSFRVRDGVSGSEFEVEMGGNRCGKKMRAWLLDAQLVLSLHYLCLLHLYRLQLLLHRAGCVRGVDKDRDL